MKKGELMPGPDAALVIMARYPEEGRVKTRLARSIGEKAAQRLYCAFLRDLARRFGDSDYPLHWAITPEAVEFSTFCEAIGLLPTSLVDSMSGFPQQGLGLGERMGHAFRWSAECGYPATILVGSDVPQLSRRTVDRAREKLDHADIVLGPADDGGYYLIAMRGFHDVFSGISMSTNLVREETVQLARGQGLTVEFTEPLFDVDELKDLARLGELLLANRDLAPDTAAEVARIDVKSGLETT